MKFVAAIIVYSTVAMCSPPVNGIHEYPGGKGAPNASWIMIGPNHPIIGWSLVVVVVGFLGYCLWEITH
jgi:hypothetical protein